MRTGFAFLISVLCVVIAPTPASSAGEIPASAMCHDIDEAARDNLLPVGVLARLLWTESRFRADAVSPVGALGVAQFMPTTAEERGLTNPFAPDQAIRHAAKLLADLDLQFGNIGLAVAAYNAGPGRVAKWLAGDQTLPRQTEQYVPTITGHTADEWAAAVRGRPITVPAASQPGINGRDLIRGMVHSGEPLPDLERSGRLLPGMERSGRFLQDVERKGRLIRTAHGTGVDRQGFVSHWTSALPNPSACSPV
jgi:hypothetical protein